MTVRNLEFLFRPRSVAVVAEPDAAGRYAEVIMRNLAAGRFAGPVTSVAAKKRSLFGIGAHMHIDALEQAPDLAIICASLADVPQIIEQLGARGTRAAIVAPTTPETLSGRQIAALRQAILDAARPTLMRVLGPGSGGLIVAEGGLNASVAPISTSGGKIALVAQSAAVATAVLDRAAGMGIGFSTALHLGASIDVDLADVLDWLAADPDTESILVQFESITDGRKFMSAARAAARNKPVVAFRSGRRLSTDQSQRPISADDVYEAALRRAGWVRVDTLEDLFDAAEALARARPLLGQRLSILANGHGLGRIAADALLNAGGRLASLSPDTVKQLGEALHTDAPPKNPLALPADVTPANWAATLTALLADSATDAVLTVYSPSPFAPSAEVATAICDVARHSERNVFTCWVGGSAMHEAQRIAAAHGVLSHDSPEKAIAIFLGIVNYQRNRQLLMQMPPSLAAGTRVDINAARSAVTETLGSATPMMPARLARQLLRAYAIDIADYPLAGSIAAALRHADEIGYPVDLALVLANAAEPAPLAPVTSGLRSSADIELAVRGLRHRARTQNPGIRISGYRLRPSAARSGIGALRLGVVDDPRFGPVIFLGPAAGTTREGACVAALPPLNLALAQDLVTRSRFAEGAPDDERMALESAMCTTLVRLSQLLTDIDEITGVELDPVHVESSGVLALDQRIRVEKRGRRLGFRRFAIRPYPQELEQTIDWKGRRLLIRPIRPEDETALGELIGALQPEDARMRFFGAMRNLPRSQLARFTQIDYDREMALVLMEHSENGIEQMLGEVRTVADPDNRVADFAIVVRSDSKGMGLGRRLLASMIDYARSRGTQQLRGETLAANLPMQRLAQELGFELKAGMDVGTVLLELSLRATVAEMPAPRHHR